MPTRIALHAFLILHDTLTLSSYYIVAVAPRETLAKERRYEVRASACFEKVVVVGKTVFNSVRALPHVEVNIFRNIPTMCTYWVKTYNRLQKKPSL